MRRIDYIKDLQEDLERELKRYIDIKILALKRNGFTVDDIEDLDDYVFSCCNIAIDESEVIDGIDGRLGDIEEDLGRLKKR